MCKRHTASHQKCFQVHLLGCWFICTISIHLCLCRHPRSGIFVFIRFVLLYFFFLFFCSRFISISSSFDVNVEFDFSFHSRRALKNHFILLDFICFSLNIFCCFVFKNQRFPSIKESSRPMNVIDQANPWL